MSLSNYDDRKWLFTANPNDLRGNLAGKLFLKPASTDQAYEFMLAKNYENKEGARDNEVHSDFVKFIVDAGMHAREIDPSKGRAAVGADTFDAKAKALIKPLLDVITTSDFTKPDDVKTKINAAKLDIGTESPYIQSAIQDALSQMKTAADSSAAKPAFEEIYNKALINVKNIFASIARVDAGFTLASNDVAKTVYNNVFAKWDNLSQDTKSFYGTYVELQKVIETKWSQVPESEYVRAGDNLSLYRLNLKKEEDGTLYLAKYFVEYNPTVFGGVRVDGTLVSPKETDIFGKLYQAAYINDLKDSILKPKLEKSKNTKFDVKVDDLIRKRFFAISKATISDVPTVPGAPEQYTYLDMMNKNIIFRDADGNFVRKINGVTTKLGQDDEETHRILKASHKCYGTNLNVDDATCKRFIFECLLSQDEKALETCLKDIPLKADFFNVASQDITNLHPVLALRILQQFGFHKYPEHDDTANMQLYKVESVAHWLKTYLEPKYGSGALNTMIQQDGQHYILAYLDLVSQYVNANPSILNKQYSGDSDEALGKLDKMKSAYGKQLGLQWEVPKPNSSFIFSDVGRLRGHLQQLRASRNLPFVHVSGQRGLYTPYGRQLTPGVSFLQTGGGGKCDLVFKRLNESGHVSGAQVIESYMNAVLSELAKRNKSLNPTDKKNIAAHLQKYREVEIELQRSLCYIDEFNTLSDVLQNYDSDILTEASLKKFVDRYSNINSKTQLTEGHLLDIIAKIQDVIGKDSTGKGETPIKVNDWM